MLKKIATTDLKIGMYISELDCDWSEQPFTVTSFRLKNEKTFEIILNAGVKHVFVDTSEGADYIPSSSEEEETPPLKPIKAAAKTTSTREKTDINQEQEKAREIYKEGTGIIRNMMENVRLGKQVEVENVSPLAENIVDSIFRNPHALTGISRIKTKDEYTFMHCVSVTGLMVMFARFLGVSEEDIHEIAIGSLVHDVGKIMVPNEVLNKPGKLNDEEFETMKDHVTHSRDILQDNPAISQTALDVALLHHERMDGSGYPLGLAGDEINLTGRMSAIVDVYDALTSVRVYKAAWEPTFALKKMLEWCPGHFSSELVQKFIQCLGIYPVGSLVEMTSGLVGIVLEQNKEILRPKLRVIYDAKNKRFVKVTDINLTNKKNDKIAKAVSPSEYGIDLSQFM